MTNMPTPNETPANGQDAMQEFERLLQSLTSAESKSHDIRLSRDEYLKAVNKSDVAYASLRAHVRKMAEDSERLDWQEQPLIGTGRSEHADPKVRYCCYMQGRSYYGPTLRAAIDAARRPTP